MHIQANAILGHDVEVREHSLISAFCGIGSNCKIGNWCYLGMSTTVRPDRKIGDDVIIGIGSVVFRNVKNGKILMENPAKVIGENTGSVFHMFE